jgi:Ferritin-like domain
MSSDPRALNELLEESQDLQADALRPTHEALDALVELNHSPNDEDHASNQAFHVEHQDRLRASLGATTLLGAAGGAALVSLLASPAFASSSSDVQILQTANSIENLAISTYKTALMLPYIGGSAANPVVTKFCQVTMGQHMQHDDAFSAAVKQLGGKAQNASDPAFVPVVNKAVKSITAATPSAGALQVVALALELENIAAETYVKDTVLAKSTTNKALFASIMGIEAQHASVLLAVQALLQAGAPQLISLAPGTAAMLPAAAGSVGFPNAFYKTNQAAPASQGAVK